MLIGHQLGLFDSHPVAPSSFLEWFSYPYYYPKDDPAVSKKSPIEEYGRVIKRSQVSVPT